jgi:hypothetical protein
MGVSKQDQSNSSPFQGLFQELSSMGLCNLTPALEEMLPVYYR